MAEIFAFTTDAAAASDVEDIDQTSDDCFLLNEGLELLADFRAITDRDVKDMIRALVKSMAHHDLCRSG